MIDEKNKMDHDTPSIFDSNWGNLRWHPYTSPGAGSFGPVPEDPGVYRIRSSDPVFMCYIGESNDLSDRISGHWDKVNDLDQEIAGSYGSRMEFLVRLRQMIGDYEISWATESCSDAHDLADGQQREALERELLWRCRLQSRSSALANHARTCSGNELVDLGSKMIDGQVFGLDSIYPSSRPLRSCGNDPRERGWMGLNWTKLFSHSDLGGLPSSPKSMLKWQTRGAGLLKLLGPNRRLLWLGYAQRSRIGLQQALNDLPEKIKNPVGAWHPLGRLTQRYRFEELRDDLIGASHHRTGHAPLLQFIGEIDQEKLIDN